MNCQDIKYLSVGEVPLPHRIKRYCSWSIGFVDSSRVIGKYSHCFPTIFYLLKWVVRNYQCNSGKIPRVYRGTIKKMTEQILGMRTGPPRKATQQPEDSIITVRSPGKKRRGRAPSQREGSRGREVKGTAKRQPLAPRGETLCRSAGGSSLATTAPFLQTLSGTVEEGSAKTGVGPRGNAMEGKRCESEQLFCKKKKKGHKIHVFNVRAISSTTLISEA